MHCGQPGTAIQGEAMLKHVHAAALAALFATLTAAHAQNYPNRAINIIVPQAAGGGTDIITRLVGTQLSEQLGVPVVIDNRAGGGTIIGTEAWPNAAPEGSPLLAGIRGNMAVNPSLFSKLKYDPI